MQSDNKIENPSKGNAAQKNSGDDLSRPRPRWLPRGLFDAIGPISLFIIVVGGVAAFYAYHYVTKDSVRLQFWIGFMFSLLAFVVLLVQSVIYAQQAEFMREQSKAMRDSVERTDRIIEKMDDQLVAMRDEASAALRQLEITDRPWLAVHVSIIGPLTFGEQGANVTFKIIAKNVGRSVAVNATIHTKVVVPILGGNVWADVLAAQAEICQNVYSEYMSYAIFPEGTFGVNGGFGISPEDLERGRLKGPDFRTDFFAIYLVGCVDYQFSGHESHHQTRFIYEVMRTDATNPQIQLALSIGQEVPPERLILQKMVVGRGDYAD